MIKKAQIFITSTFILALVILLWNFSKSFFGFEYEDSFINSAIAIEDNVRVSISRFRTNPYSEIYQGNTEGSAFYSGHYATYGIYLWIIQKIFVLQEAHYIHKTGNLILILLTLFFCYIICSKKHLNKMLILIILILSSFPVIYVLNSGLKESLSFCIGLILVATTTQSNKHSLLMMLCILILTITKRENLIYILIPFIFLPKNSLTKTRFLIPFFCILFVQILINPFYTEELETQDIGRNTFSFDFFSYQAPTYILSMIHWSGFIALFLFLFSMKLNRRALMSLSLWICLVTIYASHYRSVHSIAVRHISIFETYRYLVNATPLLLITIIESDNWKVKWVHKVQFIIILFSLFSFPFHMNKLSVFISDEEINYHANSQQIEKSFESCTILDNFSLISRLDHFKSENINIKMLDSLNMNTNFEEPIFIINRFDSEPINKWLREDQKIIKLNSNNLYQIIHKNENSYN